MTSRERDRIRFALDAAARDEIDTLSVKAARRRRIQQATVTDGKVNKSNHVRAVMRMLEDRRLP